MSGNLIEQKALSSPACTVIILSERAQETLHLDEGHAWSYMFAFKRIDLRNGMRWKTEEAQVQF